MTQKSLGKSFRLFLNGYNNDLERLHLLVFKDNRERVVVDIFDVSLREKHRDRIKSHNEAQSVTKVIGLRTYDCERKQRRPLMFGIR